MVKKLLTYFEKRGISQHLVVMGSNFKGTTKRFIPFQFWNLKQKDILQPEHRFYSNVT